MILRSTLISTSLIALLAACGGGGGVDVTDDPTPIVDTDKDGVADDKDAFPNDPSETKDTDKDGVGDNADAFPNISGTDLESFTETTVLQSLSLDTANDVIAVSQAAKSTTSANWTLTDTDYVVRLNNGDIVGIAMESIPSSVEFASTGTAFMGIVQGSTLYALQSGDVTGSLSPDASTLTVDLSWAGNEIDAQNEEQSATTPSAMTMNLTSSLSGATDCGGANILCGGIVSVSAGETTLISSTSLNANQYKAGIYGSTAENAELGGHINYVDQDNTTIVGSFIADTK